MQTYKSKDSFSYIKILSPMLLKTKPCAALSKNERDYLKELGALIKLSFGTSLSTFLDESTKRSPSKFEKNFVLKNYIRTISFSWPLEIDLGF
jgi:hypothetical protein